MMAIAMILALAIATPQVSPTPEAAPQGSMSVGDLIAAQDGINARIRAERVPPGASAAWPETQRVLAEVRAAVTSYRAVLDADARAGRPPRSCPPPEGAAALRSDLMFAAMRAVPMERRAMPARDAIHGYLDGLYPCPAHSAGTPARKI